MSVLNSGKALAKIAAVIGIVFGLIEIGVEAVEVIRDLIWHQSVNVWGFIWFGTGAVAVVFSFVVLVYCIPLADEDARRAGIYILIFGLIGSIGA